MSKRKSPDMWFSSCDDADWIKSEASDHTADHVVNEVCLLLRELHMTHSIRDVSIGEFFEIIANK